ncbi:MAG: hypothetical protein ACE5HO_18790 [bacterium]
MNSKSRRTRKWPGLRLLFSILAVGFLFPEVCQGASAVASGHTYTLAVLDLQAEDPRLTGIATALSHRLRARLSNSGVYRLMEGNKISKILTTQQIDPAKCGSAACGLRAGRALKVDLIIIGSIEKRKRNLAVDIQMLHVRSAQRVRNIQVTVKRNLQALFAFVDRSARQLSGSSQAGKLRRRERPEAAKTASGKKGTDWSLIVAAGIGALAISVIAYELAAP